MAWFSVFFATVYLQLIFLTTSSGQEFTTRPASTSVIIGGNLTLTCGATNLNVTHVVAWYRGLTPLTNNDTLLDSSGTYSIDVTENNGEVRYNLMIQNVDADINGRSFGCSIFVGPGLGGARLAQTPFIQVSVNYLPAEEFPICDPLATFNVTVGSMVTVTCTSEPGSPAIDLAWTSNGLPLDSTRTTDSSGNYQQRYIFFAQKEDNGRSFVCTSASFGLITYEETCTSGPIDVLYPPDDISVSQTTHNGLSAFRCSAPANPAPLFNWTFNVPLDNSLYNVTDNGQLLVLLDSIPCEMEDVIATCMSSNSQGAFSLNTTLCKVPTCTPPNVMFNNTENDKLTISCQMDSPVDSMEWTRIYLPDDGNKELATVQSTSTLNHEFTVNRTYANTLYQCRATNNAPPWISICHSGPLANVYFPPNDVAITLTTYNQQRALRCSATGYPGDISYKWTINPAIDVALYSVTDNKQMLVLNDVIMCTEVDIIATCEASNAIGTYTIDKILCQVPTCTPSDMEFDKTEGNQVSFSCHIDGQIDNLNWTSINLASNSTDSLIMTNTETTLAYDLTVSREHAQTLYVCSAFSEMPPWIGLCESGPLTKVFFPPNDIAILQMTHGTYTAFRCSATAYPAPSFRWTFNSSLSSTKYVIMENDTLLVIMETIFCDNDDIIATCTVQNSVATYNESIMLCKVPTCTPPGTFEHIERETATLSCQAFDPVENITWTRMNPSNVTEELASNVNSKMLTYKWEVNRDHMQTSYECRISNTAPPWAGTCQSGPLNVLYPPNDVSIIPEMMEVDGAQFESYSCTGTGNPADIAFAWNIAPSQDSTLIDISNSNKTLTIKGDIQCNTDIIATCVASNNIATYKANITLCNAPICTPTLWAITEGDNKTFLCQHDVSPVDIAWYKNDSLATASNTTELAYEFIAERDNTNASFTCTVRRGTQPSYQSFCTLGPVVVQYPPEHIAIQHSEYSYKNDSFASLLCSAAGEPQITFAWEFNNADLVQGSHYLIVDDGRQLVLLDMDLCQQDIMATCKADNGVGMSTLSTMVCEGTPSTGKPMITDEKGENDKMSGEFEFTPPLIIVIALCAFMVLLIIVVLLICFIYRSPLISVDVENRKPPEEPSAKPIKLSLAPSEHSTQDLNELHAVKLSLSSQKDDDPSSPTQDLIPFAEIEEEDTTKHAQLIGLDNPSYTSFKANGDAGTAVETKRPDLLDYMTRPDDVDITNVNVEESNVANGSAGKSDTITPAEESNVESTPAAVEETSFAKEPELEDKTNEDQNKANADAQIPEETSVNLDSETDLQVPNGSSTDVPVQPPQETSAAPSPENNTEMQNDTSPDTLTPEETSSPPDLENEPPNAK